MGLDENAFIRRFIGSQASYAKTVAHPKGIKSRAKLWLTGTRDQTIPRDIWPIRAITNHHLFFIWKSLIKTAAQNRWMRVIKLTTASRDGYDEYGKRVNLLHIERAIAELEKLDPANAAAAEYPVFNTIVNEFKRRDIDPESKETMLNSRIEVDRTIKRYGSLYEEPNDRR